ncbi:NmrA family NAD(P)-binding protein [Sorangium sp. So ce726]|uniref:SDR family oxidoreductase n=1 Tax=Sorangium sp. So ce726 TaxID=3133319 RepID=UPI003F5E9EFC
MSSASPRIVVIGSTGMLGAPVTQELVAANFAVTALVRDPEATRASKRLPAGVALVAGDVNDVKALTAAFRGHDIVYVSLAVPITASASAWRVESEGMKNIVAAAREAGIKRIAYLSSLLHRYDGFRWWVFDMKREALSILKESGIPSTVFFPSNFIESIPYRSRQGSRINLAGSPREKAYWISARDYGKQVARALALPGDASREYVVQGPEPLTIKEAAEQFAKHYTKEKLAVGAAPLGIFKVLGLFSPTFNYVWHISDAINNAPEPFQAETTWRELGKPETTVATFAASFQ